MKEIIISKTEEGMRLDKYLHKIFDKMPVNTFHKLFRKKYFEINDIKANGQEILYAGDRLTIFLSDDTYSKFAKTTPIRDASRDEHHKHVKDARRGEHCEPVKNRIVYEDKNIIIYDKEVGLLSQGDKSHDPSVNTVLNDYLGSKANKEIFKPSVVNRLDRNTRGLIIFAKTYIAAKEISSMIRDGAIDKYYLTYVNGIVKKDQEVLTHLFKKDEKRNIALIIDYDEKVPSGYTKVSLEYRVLKRDRDRSLLEVRLITGKSHQIRAELSYIGHPLLGDKKYMDVSLYKKNVEEYEAKIQSLVCYKLRFGEFDNSELKYLSNKVIRINGLAELAPTE